MIATCEICTARFSYYPSEKPGRYCSECVQNESWQTTPCLEGPDHHRWKGGKRILSCAVCDSAVKRYPSNIPDSGVVTCSEPCRRQWLSDAFTGSGHPNWKGGDTGPYGPGWAAIRQAALERDEHQCRCCGATDEALGRNPDVHHIIPVRVFVNAEGYDVTDAHFIENVISLCPGCHRKADFDKIKREKLRLLIGVSDQPADNPTRSEASD
nr:HNH endonuclease [Halomarina rubra]